MAEIKNELLTAAATENFARTIADEARRPQIPTATLDFDRPFAFVPAGYRVEDLAPFHLVPRRHSGSVYVDDAASFILYVKRYRDEGSLTYCDAKLQSGDVTFVGVLNEHTTGNAGWRDHRVTYVVPKSEEWKRWTAKNKQTFSQAEFAEFLENNMKDIASADGLPSGADMLAMALSMEINQDARFKSSIRLQSGSVEMTFIDKEDDATLKRMQVFDRFALGVAPFLNGQAYRLVARLRYRVKEGALLLWYDLIRADLVVQDATKALIEQIAAESSTPVLLGRP
jgi:uncharacterized protein YfdQ (DUF2303 family)